MDPELVGALRDNARRVLSDHCQSPRLHRFIDQQADRYDTLLWRTAADLGWLAVAVPEEYGGLGAGVAEVAILQEELGRFLAPIPFFSSTLVARALQFWPIDTIRDRWLPRLARGEVIGAVGPVWTPDTNLAAVRQERTYCLNGECAPVLDGDIADVFLVPLSTQAGPAVALLERSAAFVIESLPVADKTRSVSVLRCHDVEIDIDQVVCGPAAVALSERLANEGRILMAADSVGGAQAVLETTVEYLKTRIQFGKPIGSFQALKHRCADHKLCLETSRRILQRATMEIDAEDCTVWTCLAKFAACDCYAALAADGVQLHGGIGFTWEHTAHLFLKHAMFNQFLFGDSAQQQDRVAERLLAGEDTL